MHGFLVNGSHMGELFRAITLILRCESKFIPVKSLVSTQSARPYKNYLPEVLPNPHELHNLFKYTWKLFFT